MPHFTQKYTIVHLLKILPDGFEYSMEDWPLHVTLADVFAITGTPGGLLADLQTELSNTEPVNTKVIDEDQFGKDKTVEVKLLKKTPALQRLHESILEILDKHGVAFNSPEYTRSGFKPHSTVQKEGSLEIGDEVAFDSITLIDMFPDENPYKRRVLGTVIFGK